MRANRSQLLEAACLAAFTTARRRSVPTRPRTSESMSLYQRWRERPRRRALCLTPAGPDGVVHAIVGLVACLCQRAQFVQENPRRLCVHCAARCDRRRVPRWSAESVRARAPFSRRTHADSVARSNGTTIASMMMAPCSASSMLSAALRPGPWPGLRALTTPARGTDWQLRDGGHLMTVHNDVDATTTRAYGGPIVSAARHSFGSPQRHPERAFRRRPKGTVWSASRILSQPCCSTTESGWLHDAAASSVPLAASRSQDHAPRRGSVQQGVIAPWFI